MTFHHIAKNHCQIKNELFLFRLRYAWCWRWLAAEEGTITIIRLKSYFCDGIYTTSQCFYTLFEKKNSFSDNSDEADDCWVINDRKRNYGDHQPKGIRHCGSRLDWNWKGVRRNHSMGYQNTIKFITDDSHSWLFTWIKSFITNFLISIW